MYGSSTALIKQYVDEVASHVKLPADLPEDLKTFWHRSFNTEDAEVDMFINEVTRRLGNDKIHALCNTVKERILTEDKDRRSQLQRVLSLDDKEVLAQLLRRHLDHDGNGKVHTSEYLRFYRSCCDQLAKPGKATAGSSKAPASSLAECMEVLCNNFDIQQLLLSDEDRNKLASLLEPPQFSSVAARLYTGFTPGSRQWVFDEYAKWLNEESSRAMVVYGGHGLGKTTLAAAFACKAAFSTMEGEVMDSDVVGHFFFQHFEKKSSTPVALLRTLAYQLAIALPPLRPVMMELKREELRELNDDDVKEAFQRLLLQPFDEKKCVRFIVMSRPEAWIYKKLSTVFEQPLVVRLEDERHIADLKLFIRDQLVTVIKLAPAGSAPGRSDLLDAATQLLLDKSEGSYLYVARVLKNLTFSDSWSLDDLMQLLSGLDKSYSKDFERLGIQWQNFQESPMAHMLQAAT
ncbi:hypothetical protein GPECTOR_7g1346 [Gonium pectorale]|uniref:EF-hand domain-containing protein n=1 Tax=Gonium pectorale TaxID=33097 RepID=A0A150GUA3_GONPE|nr:hypothetical protein GPECTOR_7g1346 [Gonium pectorale]|eukprot:KXZ53447.1 hypothetical protein GPECTOR_7g1346 [Gonium pectorale]